MHLQQVHGSSMRHQTLTLSMRHQTPDTYTYSASRRRTERRCKCWPRSNVDMVKTIDTLFRLLEALVCIFMVVCVVAVCFLVALPFLPFLLITNVLKGNTCEQKFWIAAIGVLINCVYWYLTNAYLQAEFPDMVIPVVSSVTLLICLLAFLAFPP